jgi:cytochrome P450
MSNKTMSNKTMSNKTMSNKTPNHFLTEQKCPVQLEDVDLFAPGAQEHWYDAYPILHNEAPVVRLQGQGETQREDAYVLTRHEDINAVVRDWQRFTPVTTAKANELLKSGIDPQTAPNVNAMHASMVTLRPNIELWRAHKKELTDPWVGPGANRHEEMILRHADSLIDNWIENDCVEFVSEFARPLPQRVMASVLGVPHEDIPKLAKWGDAQVKAFVHGRGPLNYLTEDEMSAQFELLDGFKQYVQDLVEQKRSDPSDDMISFLTQVTYQALDRKLTDMEVNGVVYAMLIGGLETTQYALEEQAQLLCENDGLFDRLKSDRSLIRQFTEEGMRMRSPTQGLSSRRTSQDEVFQGVKVPKGSILHLRWGAANVDPNEFECPFEFRLDRKAVTRHLTFSAGARTCPGAGISRLEQQLAWGRLLERLDEITYAPDNKLLHQPGIMLGTLELNLNIKKTAG